MTNIPSCADYADSIVNPKLIRAEKLREGKPERKNDKLIRYSGGFCIVFPYTVKKQKFAVRCWHAYLDGAKERCKLIANEIKKSNLPYFVGFEYIDNAILTPQGLQPVVLMDWVDAHPIKEYIQIQINKNNSEKISKLADDFASMVKKLHEHNISHGDLQHGNILIKDDGSIKLVDYDSLYAPSLKGWHDDVKGLVGYQHPSRWKNEYLTPKADYFSELIIYTALKAISLKPDLWKKYNIANTETLLFEKEDIDSKGESSLFKELNSIDEISEMISKIKDALCCKSLDEIIPLEATLVNVAEHLSEQWNDPTKSTYNPHHTKEDINNISNKW